MDLAEPNKGRYIQTASNLRVYPAHSSEEDFYIGDIALGLGNVCRFAGQIAEWYSVAEHCVPGSYQAERAFGPNIAFEFLLHDAAEAYMGDLASPFLYMVPDYEVLRDRIQNTIQSRFLIPQGKTPECHEIDVKMLVTEARDLCNPENKWWEEDHFPKPYRYPLYLIGPLNSTDPPAAMPGSRFWSPQRAREKFINRYTELHGRIDHVELQRGTR